MTSIDLNCDMGELWQLQQDGTQARLMQYVSSVSIACGAHAGDEGLMETTMREALDAGVAIGAHPGYPDRENFGRAVLPLPAEDLTASILEQLELFGDVANRCGAEIAYVKPHGALYNAAASDEGIASAIVNAVRRWASTAPLMGLAGSQMLSVFANAGFVTLAEAFADRRYEPDGTLRSRKLPDGVITEPDDAAEQAVSIAREGFVRAANGTRVALRADTICLHSDTPGSLNAAARIHAALTGAGITVRRPAFPQTRLP
jgi:UPF0271 protein